MNNPTITQENESKSVESDEEFILTVEPVEDDSSADMSDVQESLDAGDLLKIPQGALVQFYEKLELLEEKVDETQEENEELKQALESVQTSQQITDSRLDAICDRLDTTEDLLESLESSTDEKHSEFEKRLTMLEESTSMDESAETNNQQFGTSSRLERISNLDDETLHNQFSVNMVRAVTIYRFFEEWGTNTRAGTRLKSGELRKLLNAKLDDDNLQWTQVHRAMNCFNKNTTENFEIIETQSVGKALIKK